MKILDNCMKGEPAYFNPELHAASPFRRQGLDFAGSEGLKFLRNSLYYNTLTNTKYCILILHIIYSYYILYTT